MWTSQPICFWIFFLFGCCKYLADFIHPIDYGWLVLVWTMAYMLEKYIWNKLTTNEVYKAHWSENICVVIKINKLNSLRFLKERDWFYEKSEIPFIALDFIIQYIFFSYKINGFSGCINNKTDSKIL